MFTVTSLTRIAWNLLRVTMVGEAGESLVLSLVDPDTFEDYAIGDEVTIGPPVP